jgi:hypothetical protein
VGIRAGATLTIDFINEPFADFSKSSESKKSYLFIGDPSLVNVSHPERTSLP